MIDSPEMVRAIMYAHEMSSASEIAPNMTRTHGRISKSIMLEGKSASSATNADNESRAMNLTINPMKLRMLNGLYARAICLLMIFLKTMSWVNLLITLSSSLHSARALSRSKVFVKLSSPRIEIFMMTVMALIIKANIELIARILSFMYSPVCDMVAID